MRSVEHGICPTAAILEFYFRFLFLPSGRRQHAICVGMPDFILTATTLNFTKGVILGPQWHRMAIFIGVPNLMQLSSSKGLCVCGETKWNLIKQYAVAKQVCSMRYMLWHMFCFSFYLFIFLGFIVFDLCFYTLLLLLYLPALTVNEL